MTFGPGEEEVIGAVDTEDGLAVALGHVDALQRCRAAAFGGRDRVDDTPGRQTDTHTYTHAHTSVNRCRMDAVLSRQRAESQPTHNWSHAQRAIEHTLKIEKRSPETQREREEEGEKERENTRRRPSESSSEQEPPLGPCFPKVVEPSAGEPVESV